jgi:hypothetical protein
MGSSGVYFAVFLVNWLINILAIEFLALRKIKNIIDVDEARDSKYSAFRRYDTAWFNRPWLYMTCHLSLLKFVIGISACFFSGIVDVILTLDMKSGDKPRGLRYWLMRVNHYFLSATLLYCCCSCIYIKTWRPKVCYKKYLGQNWTPSYDSKRVASVISNHASFLESPLHGMCQMPCTIAKEEAKKTPGIGQMATASGCIFL